MCYAYRYTSLDLILLIQGGLCSRGDESELQTNSCHGTNCYLVWDEFTKNAVCIDPGFAGRKIAMDIQKFNVKLKSIFITHSHADHVSGIDDMCAAIETVPVIYMSKLEMMYEDFPFKKQWGHSCHKRYWEEYSMVVIDSMQFKVIPTPGHSPGSVCIITNKYLISGDLLTNDSIGRTDFIGGNVNDMFFSLEKVLKLSDSLIVLPGHGAVTTMEKIKNCNPYVKRILQKI